MNQKAQTRRRNALSRLEAKLADPLATRQEHQESTTKDAATTRIKAEIAVLEARISGRRDA